MAVLAYVLKMNDGVGGDLFTTVATLFPNVRTYTVSGLQTALTYGFTITAVNFNGAAEPAVPVYFTICNVP